MHFIFTLFALFPFYCIGAIPSGYLVAKKAGVDIRNHGSGNVGATNVARIVGRNAGVITLALDISKGLCAVALARFLSTDSNFVALTAVVVVAGHCISIPGKLRGGKGVATGFGALLGFSPLAALLTIIVFGVLLGLSKIVSLASVGAAACMPIFAMLYEFNDLQFYCLATMALLIIIRHKSNLERLARGEEKKIFVNSPNP